MPLTSQNTSFGPPRTEVNSSEDLHFPSAVHVPSTPHYTPSRPVRTQMNQNESNTPPFHHPNQNEGSTPPFHSIQLSNSTINRYPPHQLEITKPAPELPPRVTKSLLHRKSPPRDPNIGFASLRTPQASAPKGTPFGVGCCQASLHSNPPRLLRLSVIVSLVTPKMVGITLLLAWVLSFRAALSATATPGLWAVHASKVWQAISCWWVEDPQHKFKLHVHISSDLNDKCYTSRPHPQNAEYWLRGPLWRVNSKRIRLQSEPKPLPAKEERPPELASAKGVCPDQRDLPVPWRATERDPSPDPADSKRSSWPSLARKHSRTRLCVWRPAYESAGWNGIDALSLYWRFSHAVTLAGYSNSPCNHPVQRCTETVHRGCPSPLSNFIVSPTFSLAYKERKPGLCSFLCSVQECCVSSQVH